MLHYYAFKKQIQKMEKSKKDYTQILFILVLQ